MPNEKEFALIDLGLRQLVDRFGVSINGWRKMKSSPAEDVNWDPYYQWMTRGASEQAKEPLLRSILSMVDLKSGEDENGPNNLHPWYAPAPLALSSSALMPRPHHEAAKIETHFVDQLQQDLDSFLRGNSHDKTFLQFYHLFQKYTWSMPGNLNVAGISLFQEWKAVAGMVFASGPNWMAAPDETLSLIGGDIPGIQDFVYTITSKGAAKGLRGRSMFIQLLNVVIVQRLIRELDLSMANIIYNAGGNFMILGPALEQPRHGKKPAERLKALQSSIDRALLDALEGDLSLCLAWSDLKIEAIGNEDFAIAALALKQSIAAQKRQRFHSLLSERWFDIFGPQGEPGNAYCLICQRPLMMNRGIPHGDGIICEPCDGFRQLAEAIGRQNSHFLNLAPAARKDGETWQKILYTVGHVWIEFSSQPLPDGESYALNQTDFLQKNADGFLFLANVTPRVTQHDLQRWQHPHPPGARESEPLPRIGHIRSFEQLAEASRGTKKIGVLRMDVDNLGQIMVRGLKKRSMLAVSSLSNLMNLFFSGWLNQICEDVNQLYRKDEQGEDRGDRLYVIYAGGDDLFVLGSWDLIPELAQRIHDDFQQFTGGNPSMTISAGIILEDKKFPLYQAAERAGEAEHAAKSYRHRDQDKNAIHFLGMTFRWDEWPLVISRRDEMINLLRPPQGKAAPKALLRVIQNIFAQYERQRKHEHLRLRRSALPEPQDPDAYVYYGPWMWREAYALSRMARNLPQAHREAIEKLQIASIAPTTIRHSGLAARWTELLLRKEV